MQCVRESDSLQWQKKMVKFWSGYEAIMHTWKLFFLFHFPPERTTQHPNSIIRVYVRHARAKSACPHYVFTIVRIVAFRIASINDVLRILGIDSIC